MARRSRPDIGPVGVFSFALEQQPAARAAAVVERLEDLGYGAVWVPEARGKEAFTHAAMLLRGGRRIVVATGVASIWGRDPTTAAAAANTVEEAHPGRLLVGLGVSHRTTVEEVRGQRYTAPLQRMAAYLDGLDRAVYQAAAPATRPPVVLAALGPRMLALAAERTAGAHTYFVPVEHTSGARAALGDGLLAVEVAVALAGDRSAAREVAGPYLARYLRLENYRRNLEHLGWDDRDLAGDGSDRLLDALVAWGDEDRIAARVTEHLEAGADHVCVQVLSPDRADAAVDDLATLAPALLR